MLKKSVYSAVIGVSYKCQLNPFVNSIFEFYFADFLLVLSIDEWRLKNPQLSLSVCLLLLSGLSVFASCVLKFYCLVHAHLGLLYLLVDKTFHHYVMSLFDLSNFLCSEVTLPDNIATSAFKKCLHALSFSIPLLSTYLCHYV